MKHNFILFLIMSLWLTSYFSEKKIWLRNSTRNAENILESFLCGPCIFLKISVSYDLKKSFYRSHLLWQNCLFIINDYSALFHWFSRRYREIYYPLFSSLARERGDKALQSSAGNSLARPSFSGCSAVSASPLKKIIDCWGESRE